ncbi:membrane protein [Tateyamaria sp. ANG-S1]|uniref:nickel/cobalt transporter n=1 Tax=Tateyamaria sp. ANG-S1 TaxID=1577905 RepID=UPI00058081B8|nr:membrane protein [Tateyamaria sp. ANG-S1]KIC50771.1 membrane protein [Tateyamaria sp. ANG-S1]
MLWLRISACLVIGGTLLWLFGFGGVSDIGQWAAAQQRDTQNALAGGLRAVRAGEPGAWLALMGLCGAYGFFHAAGPGHGKLVIGGYGAAERVTARRLSLLAVLSSLAQAATAILLVSLGAFVLGWGRTEMTDTADKVLAPASYIAIALVGLWLMVRGLRRTRGAKANTHHHHHHIDDHGHCSSCGHAHAPTPAQAAAVTSLRDAAAIIGSIAIRPCTGAVFLLILCFGLGIPWAGIAGAIVMGLGTASVTVLVALAAVGARQSVLAGWSGTGAVRAMALIEAAAGALIALIATALVLPLL